MRIFLKNLLALALIIQISSSIVSRSFLDELFFGEGTFWCGPGNIATSCDELGYNAETDKCCRMHDMVYRFWLFGFKIIFFLILTDTDMLSTPPLSKCFNILNSIKIPLNNGGFWCFFKEFLLEIQNFHSVGNDIVSNKRQIVYFYFF